MKNSKTKENKYELNQKNLSNPQFLLENCLPFALGNSTAELVVAKVNYIPTELRDFLYKKRPFPTIDEFDGILRKYHMQFGLEPDDVNCPEAILSHMYNDKGVCLGHAEIDNVDEDWIQYLGDVNGLGLVPIPDFNLKDRSKHNKIFNNIMKLWKVHNLNNTGIDTNFGAFYAGYLSNIMTLTHKRDKPFSKYLTPEQMKAIKYTSNMMSISVLIQTPDNKFYETGTWISDGSYEENFLMSLQKIYEARKKKLGFYNDSKLYIYHSAFEPEPIKLAGDDYASFGLLPDEVININGKNNGLDIDNTCMILAKNKKMADKQFKQWAKYRGYYIAKDSLKGTTSKLKK